MSYLVGHSHYEPKNQPIAASGRDKIFANLFLSMLLEIDFLADHSQGQTTTKYFFVIVV